GRDDRRNEIGAVARGARDAVERRPPRRRVALGPQRLHARDLAPLDVRIDPQQLRHPRSAFRAVVEPVDADDDRFAGIDVALRLVRGLLDLALDESGLDRGERAAGAVDALDQLARALLD